MDINIYYATQLDIAEIMTIDRHLSKETYRKAIDEKRVLIVRNKHQIIGLLRFGYFWDVIPMINMIHFIDSFQRKGFGTIVHAFFEDVMKKKGYQKLMTTTQKDEEGQHFFRKIGYKDAGFFSYPDQADELILFKDI